MKYIKLYLLLLMLMGIIYWIFWIQYGYHNSLNGVTDTKARKLFNNLESGEYGPAYKRLRKNEDGNKKRVTFSNNITQILIP
jgi:hypothetical protein